MRYLKWAIFFTMGFCVFSCSDSEIAEDQEEFTGIEYTTSRSNGASSGVGFACNFAEFVDDEIFSDFDLDQSFYGIIAGDSIDVDGDIFLSQGESFQILWINEGEVSTGTYDAFGMSLNIEDPENLEEGVSTTFSDAVEVTLEQVGSGVMVGSFIGTFQDEDGVEQSIEGRFNVEQEPCGQ